MNKAHSKYRCKNCKRKHHTSLCDTTASNDSGQTKGTTLPAKNDSTATLIIPVSSQPSPTSISNSLVSSTCTSCLLKIAVAEVRAGTHYCRPTFSLMKEHGNHLFPRNLQTA